MARVTEPAAGFELTTSLSNLRHLRESDLSAYDAVYLGNIHCRLYEGNFLERPAELREAVAILRDAGKRPYLTTYAAPRGDALATLRRALEAAAATGVQVVEVHALGVLKIVRDEFPELRPHVGGFANVYTDAGVLTLEAFGVARVTPSHELTLDEIDEIARETGVPMELLVHGKMPLGVSDFCILLEYEARWGVRCPDLCQKDVFLEREGWAMKSVGTGILSGRDVCMLEHLPRLIAGGHRHFRVETASESPAYRRAIGETYREALARARAGETAIDPRWWQTVRAHARIGLCNGFYFGRSGIDYVGADLPASGLRE